MDAETVEIPEHLRNLTFEKVWAVIMADHEKWEKERQEQEALRQEQEALRQKERQEQAELRQKEWEKERKEREALLEKERQDWKKQQKKLNRQMGDLHRSFGELAEHLVAPGITRRFNELGYQFDNVLPGGRKILDETGKTKTEIDLVLENTTCIMAVEVKTKPKVQDIEHHINRLKILRENRNKHKDPRKIQGAIAGAVFGTEEKKATVEAGLYVIEQSGDTMKLDIPLGFIPQEW
ncbi:MAG: hypothetical protein FWG89_04650 [Treponema sp.]|nr:hypothetical protein [Treponema sp.]